MWTINQRRRRLRVLRRSREAVAASRFQRIGDSWKKKSPFVAIQVTKRKVPAVTASIKSEPKL